jgi:hypothetical protein
MSCSALASIRPTLLGAFAIGLTACAEPPTMSDPDAVSRLSFAAGGGGGIGTESHCNPTPEAARKAAPAQGLIQLEQLCDREDLCPTCDGLFVYGWGDVHCYLTPAWDPDNDGVDNGCENALAAAFAPELLVPHDCNWDYSLGQPGVGRFGGEYFFAVQARVTAGGYRVRIAYLPAYYWDCGPMLDWKCPAFLVEACSHHTGDSEFIIVDVRYSASSSHWLTEQVFLSAHCPWSASNIEGCLWWSANQFAWVDGKRYGAPVVWVAEGKHANYTSQSSCEGGGAYDTDTCEFSNTRMRFPVVYSQQNIGSRAVPFRDCGTPFWGSQMTNAQAVECMWNTQVRSRFDGWLGFSEGAPAAPYGDHLRTYAEF